MGYYRAGFEVVGVDIEPMPRYPFTFHQADAMTFPLDGFDVIHASPPCQGYSRMRHLPWLQGRDWPLLIESVRERLQASGAWWVIENVEDAPLQGITLCGVPFGLKVYRHRKFESNLMLMAPPHMRHEHVIVPGRYFSGNHPVIPDHGFVSALGKVPRASAAAAVGIDWMTCDEMAQAIPPCFHRTRRPATVGRPGRAGGGRMTVREGPHWVYDACDQGHDYERYGDDICWESCRRCHHCRYTQEHRVAVAREQAEKERAG